MSDALLAVVRGRTLDPHDEALFQRSMFNNAWHIERQAEPERRRHWLEFVAHHNAVRAGLYVKSGGGEPTDNLQEAELFGWSRSAKSTLARFNPDYYEVLPATIAVDLTPAP